jgi:hypothetical protein
MIDSEARNSSFVQIVLDIVDELKIAVAARRIEGNEITKDAHG